jgi:apolipoprotein N-acyltransferase
LSSFWGFFFLYTNIFQKKIITCGFLYLSLKFAYSLLPLDFGTFWADLAYSQVNNNPFILKIMRISGVDTLSLFIIFINFLIFHLLKSIKNPKPIIRQGLFISLIFLILVIYTNFNKPKIQEDKPRRIIKIAAIQGNFYQSWQWRKTHAKFILDEYKKFIKEAANKFNPDIILLPEYAIPADIIKKNKDYLKELLNLVKDYNFYLVIGTFIKVYAGKMYNIALVLNKKGILTKSGEFISINQLEEKLPQTIYFKVLPVPFGESGVIKGKSYKPFTSSLLNFGVVICYEDTDPEIARRQTKNQAEILFFLANDARFKNTFQPYQHAILSIFRAIENKRYIIRLANTGITQVISPCGEKITCEIYDINSKKVYTAYQAKPNTCAILFTEIKLDSTCCNLSIYTKYRNIILIIAWCYILVRGIYLLIRQNKNRIFSELE